MLYAVALKRWETLAHGCILAAVSSLDWNSLDLSGVHPSSDLRARMPGESRTPVRRSELKGTGVDCGDRRDEGLRNDGVRVRIPSCGTNKINGLNDFRQLSPTARDNFGLSASRLLSTSLH